MKYIVIGLLMFGVGCERVCGDEHPEWLAVEGGSGGMGARDGGAGANGGSGAAPSAGAGGGAGAGGSDDDAGVDENDAGSTPPPVPMSCPVKWQPTNMEASSPDGAISGIAFNSRSQRFLFTSPSGVFEWVPGQDRQQIGPNQFDSLTVDSNGDTWLAGQLGFALARRDAMMVEPIPGSGGLQRPHLAADGSRALFALESNSDMSAVARFDIPIWRRSATTAPFLGTNYLTLLALNSDPTQNENLVWYAGPGPSSGTPVLGRTPRTPTVDPMGTATIRRDPNEIPFALGTILSALAVANEDGRDVAWLATQDPATELVRVTSSTQSRPISLPGGSVSDIEVWPGCGVLVSHIDQAALPRIALVKSSSPVDLELTLDNPAQQVVFVDHDPPRLAATVDNGVRIVLYEAVRP